MDTLELSKLEKDLLKKDSWLFSKLEEQKGLIIKSAESEQLYRTALASKMLTLKSEGYAATLIGDLSRGDSTISKLKLDRDINKGIADACKQGIYAIQSSMSALQTLISRHKAEMNLL